MVDAKSWLVVLGPPYFLVAVMVGQLLFALSRTTARAATSNANGSAAPPEAIAIGGAWMIGGTLVLFASAAAAGANVLGDDLQGWLAPLGGISGLLAPLGKSSATSVRECANRAGWPA